MKIDEIDDKCNQIFRPGLREVFNAVQHENGRFAYYTDADTAMKIIHNGELWFRNTQVMNDISEIAYGLKLLEGVFSNPRGRKFKESVNAIFPDILAEVERVLQHSLASWQSETYIACLSLHEDTEDKGGRLSMWRAYGNTALIFNNEPMTKSSEALGVFSYPVEYLNEDGLSKKISKIASEITRNREYLKRLGSKNLLWWICTMLFQVAVATKHPGFAEEKEWRIFYRPSERVSPGMRCQTVVLGGVPQNIWALRLANEPENGLHGADIPTVLNRLIVGPTEHPYVSGQAFERALKIAGVEDVESKVYVSDIPLRTG